MADASLYNSILGMAQTSGGLAMPGMLPDAWWLTYFVLLLLGAGAAIDAFKGIIPDWLVFLGLLIVTIAQAYYADWPWAGDHMRLAVAVGVGFWLANALWRRQFGGDALGMGDAKWTMLAVDCFGIMPALFAWGCGAILGVLWMGGAKLAGRKITRVHFAPFLFIGLLAGLYWLRLR